MWRRDSAPGQAPGVPAVSASGGRLEHVALAAPRADVRGAELVAKMVDIDLDHVAVAISVVVVDMLHEMRLGENPARVQHEVAQQPELDARERDAAFVDGDGLALLVEREPLAAQHPAGLCVTTADEC